LSPENPTTLDALITAMQGDSLPPEQLFSFIVALEQKINDDIDLLFEKLAGGNIHEIQSKIGYAKNLIQMVIDSKGAFDYSKAKANARLQLADILTLYKKAGITTSL
jgi:hypothetical protein